MSSHLFALSMLGIIVSRFLFFGAKVRKKVKSEK